MKVAVKSKKERLKKLSSVGRKKWRSGGMGRTVVCHNNDDGSSDGRKRLKLSKKLLNGCNVSGKTTVPRKLRTAMKKRICESPSSTLTDLKKPSHLTHEDELPEQDVVKLLKRDVVLNSSPGKSLSGPMTKDEQEVAEVLFAMASMFPDRGSNQDAHCRHISAQTDHLVLSDAMECPIKAEGVKSDSDLSVHSTTKEALSTSVNERNYGEETQASIPAIEPVKNKKNLQDKQPSEEPAKKEDPSTGSWFRSERSSSKTVGIDLGSCTNFGLEKSAEPMQAFNRDAPKCVGGLGSCSGWKLSYPSFVKGVADKALPAWSIGLQMISNGSCNPQETRTSKMPAWIDATAHSRNPSYKGAHHSKASRNTSARIPWKRCVTHAGISYLIQELKGRDTKGSTSMQNMHMKPEMDADMGHQTQASLLRLSTSGLNGVTLVNAAEVKHEPMFNEFKSGVPCLDMMRKENHLQNIRSVVNKPEPQVYDFLSLSSGKNSIDPNSGGSRTRTANMTGMSSYLSIDPVSTQGAHKAMPTLNNRYSPSHVNQASAAESQQVRLQLPILVGSSGSTLPQKGPSVLTKEQQQQQLQQQMLWAAAAHRQGLQIKFDHATSMQCSLPMMVSSFPVALPPKYAEKVPRHHHQQLSSLPRDSTAYSSSKRQRDICPAAGVQFYAGSLSPHLLCSKRL